jgi:hypothetical protein
MGAEHRMDPVIPTISTAAVGPLGILHLPRLWLKQLLFVLGRLPPDYKHHTGTFDRMIVETLGIDEVAMLAFVRSAMPDYLTFEAWVRDHARSLDDDTVRDLNARYLATEMSEAGASARRRELGIGDPSLRRGILLNDLDDWSSLHRQLVREAAAPHDVDRTSERGA